MKVIQLTQGKTTIVDDEDFERFGHLGWYFSQGYAARTVRESGKRKQQLLHRLILNTAAGMKTDHKSRDTLDNRRDNLRPATNVQNGGNCGKYRTNTSGFKGVTWHKLGGKWSASIKSGSRRIYLGLFTDAKRASEAYALAASNIHGEFARA